MPNTVIYANLLPFIGILFVLFFVKINPLFDKKQNKMFSISAITILVMLVIISIDYTLSLTTLKYVWVVRRITSFLNFSVSCAIPIFLIRIFINKKISKKANLLLYLPAVINAIVCAISMFVKLVFFLPQEGGYDRGPLFFLPSAISLIYIIVLLVASLLRRNTRAYEALFLIGVIMGFMLALYLEVVARFKFLTWDFAAVLLVLYYLLLNINKSKLDQLTGVNNRSMYVQKTDSINHARSCIIAMIDINGFKAINDEKGHAEGDKLLIQFAEIAQSLMDRKTVLYRIGGDEFAIISEELSMDDFRQRIDNFIHKLKESNITCAIGIEKYDPITDIEHAIRAADLNMYENKRKFYSSKK